MGEIRQITVNKMIPVIEELLEEGMRIRITVTGSSMYPFLRDKKDSVELYRSSYDQLKRGDIVLIRRDNGEYVLHRVVKKDRKYFYMNGDAQQWWEGPIKPKQVIAKVTKVWRKDRCILCSSFLWRLASILWMLLIPFRDLIFKSYYHLRRLSSAVHTGRKYT
jgi:SOS-response transcriptional repressor LexA